MTDSIISLVNSIIHRSVERRATDIHFEPRNDAVQIRIRVDGVLIFLDKIAKTNQPAVISRIKIMAGMDIAECRIPQDGRVDFRHHETTLQLRISTLPTLFGEKIVIRILDRARKVSQLAELGMDPPEVEEMHQILSEPQGFLLFVGPTGSGKTTTLYACLAHLADGALNISTIEDPIEYTLPGINQTQIHPKIGLTFAKGLRSLLRQDPDVIVIGEIRDAESAEVALQASLTGHLVISTLHCKDTSTAETRLIQLGVDRELLRTALLGYASQRLLRVFCARCEGRSCEQCDGTGYYGRTGIFEIKAHGQNHNRSMRDKAMEKVQAKATSQEEVYRILGRSDLSSERN